MLLVMMKLRLPSMVSLSSPKKSLVRLKRKEVVRVYWSKGIGLKNTAQRLEKMYGTVLRLEDNLPSGLKISFEL